MVALTSRFTLLAALCAFTAVSCTPLSAGAAALEVRHPERSANTPATSSGQGRQIARQPAMPLSLRGRSPREKGKEPERGVQWPTSDPLLHHTQSPIGSTRKFYQRLDDDNCSRKVVVNGDRDHVRLKCLHDHDHDLRENVVDGDRGHIRNRREAVQSRSPRHSRPLYQRQNEVMQGTEKPRGTPGQVRVISTDPADGGSRELGNFIINKVQEVYEVEVSKLKWAVFYLVITNTTTSNGAFQRARLVARLPDRPGLHCCTYDPNPLGPEPMTVTPCRDDERAEPHASQLFSYNPALGVLRPTWFEEGGDPGVASPAPSPSPPQTPLNYSQNAGDQSPKSGDRNVKMVWSPLPKDEGSKATPTSAAQTVETQTVTVTVTVIEGSSSAVASPNSALREASTTLAETTPAVQTLPWSSVATEASSSAVNLASSSSASVSTSVAQNAASPTGGDQLKIEVTPEQPPSSSLTSQTASTTVGPSPTTAESGASVEPTSTSEDSSTASNLPIGEGKVLNTVVSPGRSKGFKSIFRPDSR